MKATGEDKGDKRIAKTRDDVKVGVGVLQREEEESKNTF